jgi:hypothetical protein
MDGRTDVLNVYSYRKGNGKMAVCVYIVEFVLRRIEMVGNWRVNFIRR